MQLAPGTDVGDIAVAGDNTTIYAADTEADKAYKSTDAGVSWAELTKPAGAAEPQRVAVVSGNASVAAMVSDGNETYLTTDGGANWNDLGVPPGAATLTDIGVAARNSKYYIAVSGSNSTTGKVWYYEYGGSATWVETAALDGFHTPAGAGYGTPDNAMAVAFSPNFASDQVLLALTANATTVACEIFSLNLASWNQAAGFDNYPVTVASDNGITGINAASLALDPAYDGAVQTSRVAIVGLDIDGVAGLDGVYGLYDYDVTFMKTGVPVYSVAFDGSSIVAGTTNDRVWRSTEVQKSGSFADPWETLSGENRVVLGIYATDQVVAGTSGNSSAFHYSSDEGGSFTSAGLNSPGTDVSDLAVSPLAGSGDRTIYVTDTEADKLYKSINNGTTWAELANPAGAAEPQLVAAASDNASLVAIIADGNEAYVSTNGGSIWGNLGVPTDAAVLTDADISEAYNGDNYLAVSGNTTAGAAEVWYYKLGLGGAWVKATSSYAGAQAGTTQALAVEFSPNFSSDQALAVVTANTAQTYLELFNLNPGAWNEGGDFHNYPVTLEDSEGGAVTSVTHAYLALPPTFLGGDEVERVAFIGITSSDGDGGVYRVEDATDNHIKTGVDIYSLAYDGNYLLAGEYGNPYVWRCNNPMADTPDFDYEPAMSATFYVSAETKSPGGTSSPVLAYAGSGTVVAGTTGNESCFSVSTDSGMSFNDISLIDTSLTTLNDVAVPADGSRIYLASNDGADTSLWRRYGGSWQRVLSVKGDTGYITRVAPAEPDVVYLAKPSAKTMYFSKNGGTTRWDSRTCRYNVQDLAVESEDIAYAAVYNNYRTSKTVDSGFTWADAVGSGTLITAPDGAAELQLSAAAPDDDNTIALVADDNEAYVSSNGGLTWGNLPGLTDAAVLTDITISEAYNGDNYLAVSGNTTGGAAEVWYYKLGVGGAWVKATSSYAGEQAGTTQALAVAFSPNFATDFALAAVTTDGTDTYFELCNINLGVWNNMAAYNNYPVTVRNEAASVNATAAAISLSPTYLGSDNSTRRAFVGIRAGAAADSGIYRLLDTTDAALKTGVAINSLAYNGSSLVAGEYGSSEVWRSANPLAATPTFTATTTAPGGENKVAVVWAGGNVFAGTSGNNSALSVSADGGASFSTRGYNDAGTDASALLIASDNTTIRLLDREDNRLRKSIDGGVNWDLIPYSLGYKHSIASIDTDKVVTGSASGYVTYSTAAGANWQYITPRLESGALLTQVAASGLASGDYVFAASTKTDGKVWRWKLGTSTAWEDMAAPVPSGHGVYGLAYRSSTLYALTSDGTANSTLLRAVGPTGSSVTWSSRGSISEALTRSPSALRSSTGSVKLWAIGSAGNALYSFTETPPAASAPSVVSSSGGGGGGGGGGGAGITSFVGSISGSGRFVAAIEAESTDGKVTVTIPKDTIGKNRVDQPLVNMTIKEKSNPPAPPADGSAIGIVYEFGPAGATFDPPISLTLEYDEDLLPEGVSEGSLHIVNWDEALGEWVEIECAVDTENNTVTAQVSHFSLYTIVSKPQPAGFSLTSLMITPEAVNPRETATVSAVVKNTGDIGGCCPVVLKVDGATVDEMEVNLAGGVSEVIFFTVTGEEPGDYAIEINGLQAGFTVLAPPPEPETEPQPLPAATPEAPEPAAPVPATPATVPEPSAPAPSPEPGANWPFIGAVIGVIILVLAGYLVFRFSRR